MVTRSKGGHSAMTDFIGKLTPNASLLASCNGLGETLRY